MKVERDKLKRKTKERKKQRTGIKEERLSDKERNTEGKTE